MAKVVIHRDLLVWQKAHQLVLEIYKITRDFPSEERFGLVSQMRRAAVSVASNIVEGFGRKAVGESLHFYNYAQGSLEELKYQIFLSFELQLIKKEEYINTSNLASEVSKMLASWIRSQKVNTRRSKNN